MRAVVIENIVMIIKYAPESGEKPAYILRHNTKVPEAWGMLTNYCMIYLFNINNLQMYLRVFVACHFILSTFIANYSPT